MAIAGACLFLGPGFDAAAAVVVEGAGGATAIGVREGALTFSGRLSADLGVGEPRGPRGDGRR